MAGNSSAPQRTAWLEQVQRADVCPGRGALASALMLSSLILVMACTNTGRRAFAGDPATTLRG
jgi:hypothetical protein